MGWMLALHILQVLLITRAMVRNTMKNKQMAKRSVTNNAILVESPRTRSTIVSSSVRNRLPRGVLIVVVDSGLLSLSSGTISWNRFS